MTPDLLQFSWHAVPYFTAAALMAGAGLWVYARERGNRVSRDFLAFATLFAAWVLLVGLRMLGVDDATATVASRLVYASISLGIPPLLAFAFTVLHTWGERRRALRLHCIVGTGFALAAVGSPWLVASAWPTAWGFESRRGPLGPLFLLWVGIVIGTLAVDAIGAWRRRGAGFERRQVRLFCGSMIVLFSAALDLWVAYPVGAVCILAFTLMCGHVAVRHGFANVTARFASPEIADVMRAGFLVLDRDGVIQFVNEPSAGMLGMRRHDLLGQALREVLGDAGSPQNLAACARSPADGACEVAYLAPGRTARRQLSLSVSTMHDPRGQLTAFVCLMRDTTEEYRERQRRAAAAVPQPSREEIELRHAIEGRQLVVHYQPIVELRRGTVAGYEALVRWCHPRLGLRQPQDFLPAAEALGLIGAIDRLVLEQACADLPRLRASAANPALFVSVNQSTAALSSATLADDLRELIARCGLEPRNIRLELLENTVVNDAVRETLLRLRDGGFGICIDDFGTGHSALSRLHEAPVTALKIDRLFVKEMLQGNGRKIIGGIVALATSLDLGVVAEGVTAPEQVALLREMGCGHAQGYLYSPPAALEGTLASLRRRTHEHALRTQGAAPPVPSPPLGLA